MATGDVKDPTSLRAIDRDKRDAEVNLRLKAEHASMDLRALLSKLVGLRQALGTRARLTGDPSRFDDDREIAEDYIRAYVEDVMRGAPARPLAKLEVAIGDDTLLATEEDLR